MSDERTRLSFREACEKLPRGRGDALAELDEVLGEFGFEGWLRMDSDAVVGLAERTGTNPAQVLAKVRALLNKHPR